MISTREASLAAEAWMPEEARRHPELVGAILAGSTWTRDPEEPHPPSSDVDLFIYVGAEVRSENLDPHGRFAPRKLAFRGVVLEPPPSQTFLHSARHAGATSATASASWAAPSPRWWPASATPMSDPNYWPVREYVVWFANR